MLSKITMPLGFLSYMRRLGSLEQWSSYIVGMVSSFLGVSRASYFSLMCVLKC